MLLLAHERNIRRLSMENGKAHRVLAIYTKLMAGCLIHKAEEAENFKVN